MKTIPHPIRKLARNSAIAAAVSLAFASSAFAGYTIDFDDIHGKVYATMYVFEPSDRDFLPEFVQDYLGNDDIRDLNETDRQSMQVAIDYLSDILGSAVFVPTIGFLPTATEDNNAGASSIRDMTLSGTSTLFNAVTGKEDYGDMIVALVSIDLPWPDAGWDAGPVSVLTQNGSIHQLSSSVIHEFIHAYGMQPLLETDANGNLKFLSELAPFEQGFRDVFGNKAQANQTVHFIEAQDGQWSEDIINKGKLDGAFNVLYDVSSRGLSFAGTEVQKLIGENTVIYYSDQPIVDSDGNLIAGTMLNSVKGSIPLLGLEAITPTQYQVSFSHIELQNSMLSHQNWLNWGTLMEAELAFLQDLGFEFDRKRFFGTSLYASGQTETITQPFTQRQDGKWLTDTSSTQSLAVGTHIYGSLNTVTVAADQLADGLGAIGVRIDGVKNSLTIGRDVKVSANGQGGLGVAFTYGRNHTLNVVQGASIEADGEAGIALSFDFGSNMVSDKYEYRGSYMRFYMPSDTWELIPSNTLDAVNGALMDSVVISGTVSAKGQGGKAIYIAPNALVQKIELTNSSVVTGDIVSDWNAQAVVVGDEQKCYMTSNKLYPSAGAYIPIFGDTNIDLTTELVFNGNAYRGNIIGADGIRLTVGSASGVASVATGTVSTFTGLAQVLGVNIKPGATLTGGGTFVLTPPKDGIAHAIVSNGSDFVQETFVNDGKLVSSPATGTTYIDGNYTQSENATLVVGIDAEGNLNGLVVSGTVTFADNKADIGLVPSIDYFQSGTKLQASTAKGSPVIGKDFENKSFTYSFDTANMAGLSSTLQFTVADNNSTLTVTRQADAYSRKLVAGTPAWQRSIASILDANADTVTDAGAQTLIAKLDFTTGTGISDTISSLGGDAHMMSVRSHFALERLLDRTFTFAHQDPAPDGKSIWVQPFGGKVSEHSDEGTADTDIAGLAGGVTVESQSRTVGWHLAAAYLKSDDTAGGEAQSEGLWFGGQIKDYPYNNGTWFVEGSARVGVVNSETERKSLGQTYKTDGILMSLSASARVGAELDIGPVELTPIAGITATTLRTPSDTESGTGALDIDSRWYTSVRGQLGVKASTAYLPSQFTGYSWKWNAYAMYERELTDDAGDFKAGLKGMNGTFTREVTFNDKNRYLAGVSLGLFTETGFSASLRLDTELTHGNGSAVTGSAQLRWKF